jgi:hypothetical protein
MPWEIVAQQCHSHASLVTLDLYVLWTYMLTTLIADSCQVCAMRSFPEQTLRVSSDGELLLLVVVRIKRYYFYNLLNRWSLNMDLFFSLK